MEGAATQEREGDARVRPPGAPRAGGGERAGEARRGRAPGQADPRQQEPSRAARDSGGPRTDRGPRVALPAAARDGRGEPRVLRLLQPQPQLRGALPVPPARRGGSPAVLLRLRGPQVLLQRAGQLLPLQAQLHVEPQVGRAGRGRAGVRGPDTQCHAGRRGVACVPGTRAGRVHRGGHGAFEGGCRFLQRTPIQLRDAPGSPDVSGEGSVCGRWRCEPARGAQAKRARDKHGLCARGSPPPPGPGCRRPVPRAPPRGGRVTLASGQSQAGSSAGRGEAHRQLEKEVLILLLLGNLVHLNRKGGYDGTQFKALTRGRSILSPLGMGGIGCIL